jgi:hypothetical protein
MWIVGYVGSTGICYDEAVGFQKCCCNIWIEQSLQGAQLRLQEGPCTDIAKDNRLSQGGYSILYNLRLYSECYDDQTS